MSIVSLMLEDEPVAYTPALVGAADPPITAPMVICVAFAPVAPVARTPMLPPSIVPPAVVPIVMNPPDEVAKMPMLVSVMASPELMMVVAPVVLMPVATDVIDPPDVVTCTSPVPPSASIPVAKSLKVEPAASTVAPLPPLAKMPATFVPEPMKLLAKPFAVQETVPPVATA